MTLATSVLGIVPGLQATSVLAHNIPTKFPMKSNKNMVIRPVKRFVGTMIGVGLIKPTAQMINAL